MPPKIYNKTNFHNYTFCIFQEVGLEVLQELSLNYKSKSGSCYYFTKTGVYRLSNHWGRAANCKWRLSRKSITVTLSAVEVPNNNRTKLGYANWSDFYPDNDYQKLYFVKVDFNTQTVQFYHKQSQENTTEKVLRTATDTTKLIKQIRMLFDEIAWTKYLKDQKNIEVLRKEIIEELVNTNKSFQEIRKNYL